MGGGVRGLMGGGGGGGRPTLVWGQQRVGGGEVGAPGSDFVGKHRF